MQVFSVEDFFVNNIFDQSSFPEDAAIAMFRHQHEHNSVYRQWCDLMHTKPHQVQRTEQIPFLPISFFKTHTVTTGQFLPDLVFTSSGTTQTANSRHPVKEKALYQKSFVTAFEAFYGNTKDWCILGLLPSYLERNGSSLVLMVDELIRLSGHEDSGFYLYDVDKLTDTITRLEARQQKTLLIGVTFALLDFAAACPMPLRHTIIMETGGMKGRKKEMTRQEVHAPTNQCIRIDPHSL